MAEPASDRLFAKVKPYRSSPPGASLKDIQKMPLTSDFVADIMECLRDQDVFELKIGLFFAAGVLDSKPSQELLLLLVDKLPAWMTHENDDVREAALPVFIRLGESFRDYRAMMLERLADSVPMVRSLALGAYRTFLTRRGIPLLLRFQLDDFMSETSMGSPLIYPVRNQALAVIEALCGKTFTKHEVVRVLEDGYTVYWWDWQPFLDWWEKRQRKWPFRGG